VATAARGLAAHERWFRLFGQCFVAVKWIVRVG
jgi:hypothetical protein